MSKTELEKELEIIRYILSITQDNIKEQKFWKKIYKETQEELAAI